MSDLGKRERRKAWLLWALLTAPSSAAGFLAMERFGVWRVLPVLMALLAAVMLYQRHVKGREWRSILWGDPASKP